MNILLNNLQPEEVIRRLKQGEILKNSGGDTIEMVDGVFVKRIGRDWAVGYLVWNTDYYYFEDPDPELELEIGRFYRTRADKKAFVFSKNAEGKYCVVVENEMPYSVYVGGCFSNEEESDKDLVEPYEKPKAKAKRGRIPNKELHKKVLDCLNKGMTYDETVEKQVWQEEQLPILKNHMD